MVLLASPETPEGTRDQESLACLRSVPACPKPSPATCTRLCQQARSIRTGEAVAEPNRVDAAAFDEREKTRYPAASPNRSAAYIVLAFSVRSPIRFSDVARPRRRTPDDDDSE
jgi:hypothetical protein